MKMRAYHKKQRGQRRSFTIRKAVFLALFLAASCGVYALIQDFSLLDPERHAAYITESVGYETLSWGMAGKAALAKTAAIRLPFREVGFIRAMNPAAAIYRFEARRGQTLRATLQSASADSAKTFLFLLEFADSRTDSLVHVMTERGFELAYEPPHTCTLLLHVHTQLVHDGRYVLQVESEASLTFPVAGKDSRAILCPFGARRAGGTRKHMGVDIFANRGTPLVAAVDGYIERVGSDPLGGRVIWLKDARRDLHLYYAHLDKQLVRRRTWVRAGDTIGTVGNTGNAHSVESHLHFGIYTRQKGYIDPFPYIDQKAEPPVIAATDVRRLGSWSRAADKAILRRTIHPTAPACGRVHPHSALQVIDTIDNWLHVYLADGSDGYLPRQKAEPAVKPFCRVDLSADRIVYNKLGPGAAAIDTLPAGTRAPVLSRHRDFLHVQLSGTQEGWIRGYGCRLADGRL